MTTAPVDRLETIEGHLIDCPTEACERNSDLVGHVEGDIVSYHDGGVEHVPAVITRLTLRLLVEDLASVTPSNFDKQQAERLVAARSLANCVGDTWNPSYQSDNE